MTSNTDRSSGSDGLLDRASPKTVSVLFICLGNICRSPMAEAVFRHLTTTPAFSHPNLSISRIDSAGTAAYHTGSKPDPRTMSTLIENGIVDYRHAARKVSVADFVDFDYILAMDRENLSDLLLLMGKKGKGKGNKAQVMLFGDFGGAKGEEVVDPYYGARDGFDVAYEQMVRFTEGFVKEVGV